MEIRYSFNDKPFAWIPVMEKDILCPRVVSFVRSAFVILLLYRLKKFRDIILNLSQEHIINVVRTLISL